MVCMPGPWRLEVFPSPRLPQHSQTGPNKDEMQVAQRGKCLFTLEHNRAMKRKWFAISEFCILLSIIIDQSSGRDIIPLADHSHQT
jgi:hypothetical protein